jgi:hypothetical protein
MFFEKILNTINITNSDTIIKSKKTIISYKETKQGINYSISKINVELVKVISANNKPIVVKNLNGKVYNNYTPLPISCK